MSNKNTLWTIALLASTAIAGVALLWKAQPTHTTVDEHIFRATLPGHWSRQASNDPARWSYGSDTGRDQLTVSLLSSTHPLSRDEQIATLKRVVELRRRAEAETPGVSGVTMTGTAFAEQGGVQAARFSGVEAATKRRFYCLLLCNTSAATVFYYETVDLDESKSEARARAIFNSIAVSR